MTRTWSGLTVALLSVTVSASFAAEGAQPTSAASKNQSQPRITSQVDVHPMAPLTDREEVEVSFAAGRILKHIAQARQAIGQKKNDAAASHIAQGLKLVAIIESVLPHAKVKAEIKSGDLVYTDEDDVTARYITLFDELERRDIISPVMQAKKEAEQKHSQGNASAPSRAPVPIAVSRADIAYSSAKLDIVLTAQELSSAKQDLAMGKPEAADEALLAIQSDGVMFEHEEIEMPLEEVADNLKLAEAELKDGDPEDAKAALHVAMDELKRYEKMVGEKRGSEVKALHQEIDKLAVELGKGTLSEAERQQQASKITEWWHTAIKWLKSKTK